MFWCGINFNSLLSCARASVLGLKHCKQRARYPHEVPPGDYLINMLRPINPQKLNYCIRHFGLRCWTPRRSSEAQH
jgi:hypothetical protein